MSGNIQIKVTGGITQSIKKHIENQGGTIKNNNLSVWQQVMTEVSTAQKTINEFNASSANTNKKNNLFSGEGDASKIGDKSSWATDFKVKAGEIIELAVEVWNKIVELLTGTKPETSNTETQTPTISTKQETSNDNPVTTTPTASTDAEVDNTPVTTTPSTTDVSIPTPVKTTENTTLTQTSVANATTHNSNQELGEELLKAVINGDLTSKAPTSTPTMQETQNNTPVATTSPEQETPGVETTLPKTPSAKTETPTQITTPQNQETPATTPVTTPKSTDQNAGVNTTDVQKISRKYSKNGVSGTYSLIGDKNSLSVRATLAGTQQAKLLNKDAFDAANITKDKYTDWSSAMNRSKTSLSRETLVTHGAIYDDLKTKESNGEELSDVEKNFIERFETEIEKRNLKYVDGKFELNTKDGKPVQKILQFPDAKEPKYDKNGNCTNLKKLLKSYGCEIVKTSVDANKEERYIIKNSQGKQMRISISKNNSTESTILKIINFAREAQTTEYRPNALNYAK